MRYLGDEDLDDVLEGMGYELSGDDDDEISGYGEEIVGDELDQILMGAAPRRGGIRRRQRRAAKVQLAREKRALQRVENKSGRRYPLGLGATTIGAGATAIISANPQLPFRVDRLVTPSTGLLIENLQVGTVSQFVAAGAVPVEVFAPNAFDVELRGDTAVPGVSVQITVSNPTAGALVFSGAILGPVAQ